MKKASLFLAAVLLLAALLAAPAFADTIPNTETECLPDGCYIETTIGHGETGCAPYSAARTASNYKITRLKNSNNDVLWYVKVTGTFTYDGSKSTCTASTVTAATQAAGGY